jgi:DNA polymerase-3 subunit gamma/tau
MGEPIEACETAPQRNAQTASALPPELDPGATMVEVDQGAASAGQAASGPDEDQEIAADAVTAPVQGDSIDLEQWHQIFAQLDLDGVARELAANCILESCENGRAVLALDSKHSHLCTSGAQGRLEQALGLYFSASVRSEVRASSTDAETPADRAGRQRAERQRQAEQAIAEDPNVQTMMQTFGATIRPRTVTPNTESGR